MKMKVLLASIALLSIAATTSSAAVVHPASSVIAGLTVVPADFIDSAAQAKSEFGDLGDASVLAAMKTAPWFGASDITQVGGGNCGGSGVTCYDSPSKGGSYSSVLANLFVVHVGGQGGGTILAYLYDHLTSSFDISGFRNGVSWIRSYSVPSKLEETPAVPLPGALGLLLAGLGGLGVLGRMRKRA